MKYPANAGQTRRGSVLVEFALLSPLLLLLLAGCLDVGLLLRTALCVAEAARAGAQYGSTSPAKAYDTAGMQAAALDASPNTPGLSATGERVCYCSDGSSVACNGSCASGGVQIYVRVTAQATCPTIFSYPGLPFSGALSSAVHMRVQ
jgi:Flp pilus assembly protein TadG